MTVKVSEAVKAVREARGLSISELARRAGIAKATVSDLEANAGRSPGLDTLAKIAEALDVHVATLIGVESDEGGAGIREVDGAKTAQRLGRLGLQLAPEDDGPTRYFTVGRGISLHAIRLHPGDVLIVTATGEPAMPGAVVIQNREVATGFEVRLFLDPYLIGPDCAGVLRHDMKQSPNLNIIGGIAARIGALA